MKLELSNPLTLPCGVEIPNRLAKAAMTEGLAEPSGEPNRDLARLYGIWSDGGAGLLISGNILIDGDHLERPGNVIIDKEPRPEMIAALRDWSSAATRNGNQFWAQISHAGRQTQKAVNPRPKAPSSVKLGLPGGQFGEPVAMTQADIDTVIEGFVRCARVVKRAGFTGVQVHAAHGYLISQFLSPRSNQRSDSYGGSLENRASLLLEVVAQVRAEVGAEFPVAVKLNSADFQKGGFAFEDSIRVAKWLQQAGVDLIEISGGTYEQPKLLGVEGIEAAEPQNVAESSLMREAYFVDFALAMQSEVSIPLMVTGGFRQRKVMQDALDGGAADIIGLGRPMCVDTDAPNQLLSGIAELQRYENTVQLLPNWASFIQKVSLIRAVASFAIQYWYYAQLLSIARTEQANRSLSVFSAVIILTKHEKSWLKQRRKYLSR
ncbi:MAG: 2,4-dienoyl-CoA reductase-like NADH-dependent reductase (Old Yellow Enzyme family) [Arenicella sp.]|jgi:2,4-dienoyl-CoA reductase-like NADH-dependent reductase (Old Yellow Enzyme family)